MKRYVKISICVENAAFDDDPSMEVSRILNTAARKIDQDDFDAIDEGSSGFFLFDSNGNKCGMVQFVKE